MSNIRNKFFYLLTLSLLSLPAKGQVLSLDSILQRIDQHNIRLQSYSLKAKSYEEKSHAAGAWMAPMIGAGTFMTPYPNKHPLEPDDKGMLMFQIEQDIPGFGKKKAKKQAISSKGEMELANRNIVLNTYKAQAKKLYYAWSIAQKKIRLLKENEVILEMMKKVEELRYTYNQGNLSSIYKIKARLAENENMLSMQDAEIEKSKFWLKSLMNSPETDIFTIDTSYTPSFIPLPAHDTTLLGKNRSDILAMNIDIQSMGKSISAMQLEKRPDFKIRYEHMQPFSSMMPAQYSLMVMTSIPIVPWASKMYRSDVKAMKLDIQTMEKQKSAMLQEMKGMLYGMQYEIISMQSRIRTLETRSIPALKKAYEVNYLNYQENKLELPVLIDTWEAWNMIRINLCDEQQKLYEMIADYEKEIYR